MGAVALERYEPRRDPLRYRALTRRAYMLRTYLVNVQLRSGRVGLHGFVWIEGMTYARIALELTTADMSWSDRSVCRAMAELKRTGQVVVFKNKQHRGTARIRVIPRDARARVLRSLRRKKLAAELAAIAPVEAATEPPSEPQNDEEAAEVRPPSLAVPVIPFPGTNGLYRADAVSEIRENQERSTAERPSERLEAPPGAGGTAEKQPRTTTETPFERFRREAAETIARSDAEERARRLAPRVWRPSRATPYPATIYEFPPAGRDDPGDDPRGLA